MNENIDVRMSNYLTILSNPEVSKMFEPEVVRNMQYAVAIYAEATSKEYVNNYKAQKASAEKVEEVNSLFR